jgi:hypothetical protein
VTSVIPAYGLYLSLKKKIHVESHIVVPVFVLAWFLDLRQVWNLRPTRLFSSVLFLPVISFLHPSVKSPRGALGQRQPGEIRFSLPLARSLSFSLVSGTGDVAT